MRGKLKIRLTHVLNKRDLGYDIRIRWPYTADLGDDELADMVEFIKRDVECYWFDRYQDCEPEVKFTEYIKHLNGRKEKVKYQK